MGKRFKVGVQLHPQHTTMGQLLAASRRAEEVGCDSLWTWDHFYPLYGEPEGPHFEGWVTLTAMALSTERITVGHLVACNSYRNPELVADMARTLEHAAGAGRVVLGFGAGWFEKDYDEYGYEFGEAIDRLRALGKALPRVRDRLAKLNPAPLTDIPILVGGGGEKVTLKIVARYADAWNAVGVGAEVFARKNKILDQHCADVGRDPADIERTALIGADNIAEVDAFVEAGAQHLILMMGDPFEDWSGVEALLAASAG